MTRSKIKSVPMENSTNDFVKWKMAGKMEDIRNFHITSSKYLTVAWFDLIECLGTDESTSYSCILVE